MEPPRQHFSNTFAGLKVLHVFPYFFTLGGVESVLRLHHRYDPEAGVESQFIIQSEPPRHSDSRLHFLSIVPSDSLAEMSRKMRQAAGSARDQVAIYHMDWALPVFSSTDGATRRILMQHGDLADLHSRLAKVARYLDGIFCVNESLSVRVQESLPAFPRSRIYALKCPIDPPASPIERPLNQPIKLGYCGRLMRAPKRAELIPSFLEALAKLGVSFQFEILGDGPEREFLERELKQKNARLHGAKTGPEYWSILQQWDFILYFSDTEGTPIALLEAMSQGVIPIFPRLGSGGDSYVASVLPRLVYPKGNLEEAARTIADLIQLPADQIRELRTACQRAVQCHSVRAYFPAFYQAVTQILNAHKVSTATPTLRYRLLKHMSLQHFAGLSTWRDRILRMASRKSVQE